MLLIPVRCWSSNRAYCSALCQFDRVRETLHSLIIAKAMTDIKYIQIDVGKTFKEQVLRWFTLHNIPQADSMILTDEHAGDVLGLDYICSVQPFSPTDDIDFTPIFFPYLVQKKLKEGQDVRRANTAGLECNQRRLQEAICSFILIIHGTSMMHGEYNVYLGFFFWRKSRVAYISDVSRSSSSTKYGKCNKVLSVCYWWSQLDLLILDSIYKKESHNTYLCFLQRQPKDLNTKRALLIGMTSEFDHPKDKEFLEERSKRKGKDFSKACDGSRISIDL
ncbi:hypothetical protein HID58_040270 [Brassica napus]|uniref:Uncharacterized protein n=1 Tax=Brassica napus TaxID=3708 RepID=A0ABQ8B7L5_BRANA|nr:hypothetical protein HID58_040270 [Brassica napus]